MASLVLRIIAVLGEKLSHKDMRTPLKAIRNNVVKCPMD
nr:MAG TPA: histidine kinase-like protein [Bacteriophage sp.]